MAEKVLQTKIALLCKPLADWQSEEFASYKPLKGEVCIAEIPADTQGIQTAPTVLFKVGDGETFFSELNWASARAADVYAWAKKENLEFSDLSEAFMASLDSEILDKVNFRIVDDGKVSEEPHQGWKLQKSTSDSEWEDVSDFEINPEIFATNEYVDANISDTMTFIMQQDDAERAARIGGDNLKVDKEISGTNGKARIFNEADGGGAKFEHTDGSEAFVGVNDGGEEGLMAQIYADVQKEDGKWYGAKLDVTNNGMYYTVGDKPFVERAVASNEIATIGDISGGIAGLAEIARTGDVNDLIQTEGDILILNCNF